MGILATQEERNLKWSEMTGRFKGLTFLMLGLVFLMATALYLGIEPDGNNRVETLVRGLLGQGDVKSAAWLWTSRLSLVAIVIAVVAIRREQSRIVAEKHGRTGDEPAVE